MKTLIITKSTNMYFFNQFVDSDICIQPLYKERYSNLGVRSARALSHFVPLCKYMYGEWFTKVKDFERIVVFDTCLFFDKFLLRHIAELAKTSELYVYGWNIDYSESEFTSIKAISDKSNFTYFSYDYMICEKYGLKFNTIMYDINFKIPIQPAEQEVVFVGKAKDRYEEINTIKGILNSIGVTSKIIVIDDVNEITKNGVEISNNYISYENYTSLIAKSNVILDVTQENQTGFSMRVMEAIFFGKKLISTNLSIYSNPLYFTGNIYLLNTANPDYSSLKKFINKKFVPYPQELIEYYSMQNWVSRFHK